LSENYAYNNGKEEIPMGTEEIEYQTLHSMIINVPAGTNLQ